MCGLSIMLDTIPKQALDSRLPYPALSESLSLSQSCSSSYSDSCSWSVSETVKGVTPSILSRCSFALRCQCSQGLW
jgi:hypothetical protein